MWIGHKSVGSFGDDVFDESDEEGAEDPDREEGGLGYEAPGKCRGETTISLYHEPARTSPAKGRVGGESTHWASG